MTKAGRKRKLRAKRSPSGKVNSWEDPRSTALAKRIRDQVRREISHPHYGFPLGILHATNFISDDEFDAGTDWAKITYRFAQMQGLELPMPKAVNFMGRLGGSLQSAPDPETIAKIKADKARVDGVVATADAKGIQMMIQCCIEDLEPWAPTRLKNVLTALAEFRAGRKRRERGSSRRNPEVMART